MLYFACNYGIDIDLDSPPGFVLTDDAWGYDGYMVDNYALVGLYIGFD